MFDGILFDLDGTLWDSVSGVTKSWNIGILEEKVDRAPLTEEDVRAGMGKTLPDIAAILFPMLERPRQLEVMDRCCQVENEYLAKNGAYVFPGVEETLKTLSAQCPLFVVSNCQSGYIEAFFAGTGLGKYFAGLVSENPGGAHSATWASRNSASPSKPQAACAQTSTSHISQLPQPRPWHRPRQ